MSTLSSIRQVYAHLVHNFRPNEMQNNLSACIRPCRGAAAVERGVLNTTDDSKPK